MANISSYRFNVPEARKLASLQSIRQDVEATLGYCARLNDNDDKPFDAVLWEALCVAAVVRYARCFNSGSREPLVHSLFDSASKRLKDSHEYFIAVRSKHVAHSVNAFEENDITVTLREDGADISILGIGARHGRRMGLAFGEPQKLAEIATWVQAHVNREIEYEQTRLLSIAHQAGVIAIQRYGKAGSESDPTSVDPRKARQKP